MSGHSKWSTIKRQKGAADIKRGMTFTKIANAIIIATRLGGSGDPNSNSRLRMALDQAKTFNMPKDNIERAIDRGLGRLPGQVLEEIAYEGFGPGKVAFYVEAVTDNKLRTLQELRNCFERFGGSLAGLGSTSYMFDSLGEIKVQSRGASKEDEIFEIIDLGAQEVEEIDDEKKEYLIYIKSPELNTITDKLTKRGYKVMSSETIFKPTVLTEIKNPEIVKKVLEFTQKLQELDDIQKVYSNFDMSEHL